MKTIAMIALILFTATLSPAKDHKPEDYPLKVVVKSADYHASGGTVSLATRCDMVVGSGSTVWTIDSKDWHCRQFPVGTELYGRLRDVWGQHFIYLAWPENGKLREAYWVINSAGNAVIDVKQAPAQPIAANEIAGTLKVSSAPEGADIYADGHFFGNGPATLKLKPGKHTLLIKMSGYKEWSRDISTEAGTEARLNASLEKQD